MRLKNLIIFGFKSFADKTILHFDSGVTCIVGPNGCGKSNISDAFRWVLGEQSAKSIRGAKMPDIIFAGTNLRKPLNFAEVSLTLTDIEGFLPLDYEEVTITRRLYRSGESEYLLNGNPVRLKDLQSLFLDSGIGKNAFSIFEQGKLDQVVSYTPFERRHIFEEASGIVRFLQRKKEALKRLELSEANLNRVQDIYREVEKQILSLQEQADKARIYKENRLSLERLEKICYFLKWQNIQKKQMSINHHCEEQKALYSKILADEQTKKQALDELKNQIDVLAHDLAAQKEAILILKEKKASELQHIDSIRRQTKENRERTKKLKLELESLFLNKEMRLKTRLDIDQKYKKLESDWKEAELNSTNQQDRLKIQETEISRVRKELGLKQQAHLNHMHVQSQLQSDLKQMEVRLENYSERKKSIENHLLELAHDFDQIAPTVINRRNELLRLTALIEAHKDRLEQYEGSLQEMQKEEELKKGEIEILRRSIMESNARQKALIRMRDEHEGFSSGSKKLLALSNDSDSPFYQKVSPLYEFFSPQPAVAEAVAAVMQAYSQTLVVKELIDFFDLIAFAQKNGLQDYSLICLEKVSQKLEEPKKNAELDFLFKQVNPNLLSKHFLRSICLRSLPDDDKQKTLLEEDFLETCYLEGAFVDSKGVFFKTKLNESQPFLRESELDQLEKLLTQKQSEVGEKEKALKVVQQKSSQLYLERAELDKVLRRDEMKLAEANFSLQKMLSEEEKNSNTQKKFKEELSSLIEIYEDCKQKFKEIQNRFTLVQSELSQLEQEKALFQKNLEKQEVVFRVLQQDQKSKEIFHQQLLESRQQLLHEYHLIEVKEQNHEEQVFRIEEELNELGFQEGKLIENEKTSLSKLSLVENQKTDFETSHSQLNHAWNEANVHLKDIENHLIKDQDQLKKISGQINQYQIHLAEIHAAYLPIVSELQERYQTTIEEVSQLKLMTEESLEQVEKSIRLLRHLLQEVGNVNLTAIEDLEQHRVRGDFLKKQIDDLQNSKIELIKIIEELNRESKILFTETFELIRSNFKKNFSLLFEGGEADLQLTEPEDVLESGVEIIAKPPGKQMRSITLLSGGEKCLTAVALLFAIFEVRPAPFCILDEIDAPLDDSNVDRFVNVVRHFSSRCQFLIITHNKRTMSIGDVLFGISMQERGVSKLLALEFAGRETPNIFL